jgi:hypothetical protein
MNYSKELYANNVLCYYTEVNSDCHSGVSSSTESDYEDADADIFRGIENPES